MRTAATVGTLVLVLLTACTPRWNFLRRDRPEAADMSGPAPAKEQVLAYLNENASRLRCLRCQDLELSCSQGLQPPVNLHGQMVCQQPRNFRLTAEFLGRTELDLGSNAEEFWYWVRRSEPAYQFHCSYKDIESGTVRYLPFPFRPDWLLEVLGMSDFGPPERYQMLDEPPYLKLIERARSPQGQVVRKVMVLRRRPVQVPTPQVAAYQLLDDASGREICSAQILETQIETTRGGIVPRRLVVSWPETRAKVAMRLETITAAVDFPPGAAVFVRRPLPGYPSYDLASGRIDSQPSSLQRAGGPFPYAR
jgi:hypothetical protein